MEDNIMRYTENIEICDVCGKRFSGIAVNIHGSYEYIRHTNFSNNIGVLFARTKNIPKEDRADAIVKEFFSISHAVSKTELIEFLECFKHYRYDDKDLLNEVFQKIQHEIDNMLDLDEVKEIISTKILNNMNDGTAAQVLREIIFDDDNDIDWEKVGDIIIKYMPEINNDKFHE